MSEIRARGIIIKQSDYGEGHRMLSIFTEEYGIVKASSYRVKKSSGKAASSQFLCYGDFALYKGVGRDIMTVNSADILDGFYPISEDIKKLALCAYLADITYSILGMNNPDARLMRLLLNCVYALAYKDADAAKVKAVYELKLMCAGGYMPFLGGCTSCGSNEIYGFDLSKGGTVCRECVGKNTLKINKSLHTALCYIAGCEDKKMLSFEISPELLVFLAELTEKYVMCQLDINPQSLDYYKSFADT